MPVDLSTARPLSLETTDGPAAVREARRLLSEGEHEAAQRWALTVPDISDDLSVWSATAALLRRTLPLTGALPRKARIALLGTSTTSQLATLLPLACARAGLEVEVYECPYGQYRQEVLDPDSALHQFHADAVVLAMHDRDVELPLLSSDPEGDLDRALAEVTGLWDTLLQRGCPRIVQFTMAEPPERAVGHLGLRLPGARQRLLQEFNLRLGAAAPAAVSFVDVAHLAASVGTRTWFDARYWHLAKQAVNPACIPLLARHTGAVLAAAFGLSRKCLVLDLDNTLWGGVLGEDGLTGIRLGEGAEGEAYTAFQEHVLALKTRGVVLAVCSKNDEDLVRDAFSQHRGMRVRLADIAVLSAGWDDKAAQLRRIAEDLGIGLDALVFVDDNPVEREVVRRLVPEVDVVRLPVDPAGYVRALADYPYFETQTLTAEDAQRTEQYQARAAAASLASSTGSLEEFLESLQMQATISPVTPADLPRVAQLVGKTNQFNLTGVRRGQEELEALLAEPGVAVLTARLSDRFADHGLVGVLIGRRSATDFVVDTWLMSCRVIGRTLEHEMLAAAAASARSAGCHTVVGTYVPTAKNGLVADLYPRLGFQPASRPGPEDGVQTWACPLADLPEPPGHIRVTPPHTPTGDDA